MRNNKPTFKQQWVLSIAGPELLYTGHLHTHTFSPFRGQTDSTINSFLRRMERAGWIDRDFNPSFYRLTEKSLVWKKENSDKMPCDYDKAQWENKR